MFTQCPNCQTAFRINAEQLRVAQGRVRCDLCNHVFNALEHFAETENETEQWPESQFVDMLDIAAPIPSSATDSQEDGLDEAPVLAPDLLSEMVNELREAELTENPETRQPSPTDTRFSDYLAELEQNATEASGQDSASGPDESRTDQALLDSLDIDEDIKLDLPDISNQAAHYRERQVTSRTDPERFETAPGETPVTPDEAAAQQITGSDRIDEDPPPLCDFETPTDPTWLETTPPDPEETTGLDSDNDPPRGLESISDLNTRDLEAQLDAVPEEQDMQLEGDLEPPSEPLLTHEYGETEPLPYRLADKVPELAQSDDQAVAVDEVISNRSGRRLRRVMLGLLILLLMIGALLQFSWINREQLITHPLGKSYLGRICELIDCKLPVRRAPEKFEVISRSLVITPDQPETMQFSMTFSNTANFPQPYPGLLLSLYDGSEKLMARRLFNPTEYLDRAMSEHSLIKPRETVSIRMALEEPGEAISGYRFDFE